MNHDFHGLINSTSNARLRIRYLAVSHFLEGKSRTEISQFLKVSRTSVNKWVKAYLDLGLEGLQEKAHTGRPHRLTEQQLNQLKKFVTDSAIKKVVDVSKLKISLSILNNILVSNTGNPTSTASSMILA